MTVDNCQTPSVTEPQRDAPALAGERALSVMLRMPPLPL